MAQGSAIQLDFEGDASDLQHAARQAEAATVGVADSVSSSSQEMQEAAGSSTDLTGKLSNLGNVVDGATTAIDSVGGSLQALADIQSMAATRAARQARLIADVEQAQLDLNQAFVDSKQAVVDAEQAAVDLTQAQLDAVTAQQDYSAAVKEHGANSVEARQAAIDLAQAQHDINQATVDAQQFTEDAAQATRDAKDAQLDLNDANAAAHPTDLQHWADQLGLITPLLTAVVGILGLVTAAQWVWNASLWASPVTWIVLAIAALVAIIVIIATKTTWFQDIWNTSWGWIKKTASDWWEWMKTIPDKLGAVFSKVAGFITAPFRAAFNFIADAWNHTIGSLHWSVPGWVPGIGGSSLSAPRLPHFHTGGTASGALGGEFLAVLQAGERVSPAGGGGHAELVTLNAGSSMDDAILDAVRRAVGLRGGDPVRVLRYGRG